MKRPGGHARKLQEFSVNLPMRFVAMLMIGYVLTAAVLPASGSGLAAKKKPPAHPIVINKATVEEFLQLPGLGPVLARRIVEFRTKHGPFRRLEDLLVIQGVSRKKFEAWKPYLRLN